MHLNQRNRIRIGKVLLLLLMTTALMALTVPVQAATTTVTFTDFSDISSLELSGSTAGYGNPVLFGGQRVLRLTSGLWQAGGAFLRDPIQLTDANGFKASFSTAFDFQITQPVGCTDTDGVQGADGLVFVVQTQSNQYGGNGFGMGYYGIPHSVGIEFDTWNNGGIDSNDGNHVGIDVNGDVNSLAIQHVSPAMNNGGIWHAWVDYDGDNKNIEVRVSQAAARPASPTLARSIDLPAVLGQSNAYVGFTSGTGCAGGDHDIRGWQFTNTYQPIAAICAPGITWKSPLSAAGTYSMPNGSNLPIAFSFCDANGFVHDEGVVIQVVDHNSGMPISAWVFGSDIVIDDTAKEYRQTFSSGLYGLSPGMDLDVEAYIGGALAGTAHVSVIP